MIRNELALSAPPVHHSATKLVRLLAVTRAILSKSQDFYIHKLYFIELAENLWVRRPATPLTVIIKYFCDFNTFKRNEIIQTHL